MDLRTISKAIAGGIAGAAIGNGTMIAMTAEQASAMPWWGVILANVVYIGVGYGLVYLAPRNTTPPAN